MSDRPTQQQVTVGLQVRCQRCTENHPRSGRGQILGSMGFVPHMGAAGKWAYLKTIRWKQRDYLHGGQRATEYQTTGEMQFSGGVSFECPRCRRKRRQSVKNLAGLAAEAHASGRHEITI